MTDEIKKPQQGLTSRTPNEKTEDERGSIDYKEKARKWKLRYQTLKKEKQELQESLDEAKRIASEALYQVA